MYTNNNNKAADVATGDSIDLGEEIEIQATQHSKICVSLYHGLHCDITPDVESSWTARTAPIAIRDFTDVCGPTFHIDADSTSGSIFSHLFPDHVLATVVQQTNLYASQEMAEQKYANWEKLTVTELRAYFGFNFLMAPSNRRLWEK